MKFLNLYKNINCKTEGEVFDYLINNLKPSILLWDYFVNWKKVFNNVREIEIGLNTMNYLIGVDNFDTEFKALIRSQPQLFKIIPLLAVRMSGDSIHKFDILLEDSNLSFNYLNYDFKKNNLKSEDIDSALLFVKKTGVEDLFVKKKIKNLVDYMVGVEAGIDSNGRKNRSGKAMENIVEKFIQDLRSRDGEINYLKEANSSQIKKKFNIDIPVDKHSRRYDFVIKKNELIIIIETNYYGGGGSKLKATAGEYKGLNDLLKKSGFKFVWLTDGFGWKSTKKPFQEAFSQIDHIFNLKLLELGALNEIM